MDFMLPVTLYSLRKVYKGPIHIVHKDVPEVTVKGFRSVEGVTENVETDNGFSSFPGRSGNWCRKAYHHISDYPFDVNMYYDWDHVWFKPIDEGVFDRALEKGLCSTTNPLQSRLQHRKEMMIKQALGLPPDSPSYKGLNGGFVTAVKNHPLIYEWMDRVHRFRNSNTALGMNPEEYALTSLYHDVGVEDPVKTSLCFDLGRNFTGPQEHLYSSCAAHGALKRLYFLHEFWKIWHELYDLNFMGYGDRFKNDRHVRVSVTRWLGHYSKRFETSEEELKK